MRLHGASSGTAAVVLLALASGLLLVPDLSSAAPPPSCDPSKHCTPSCSPKVILNDCIKFEGDLSCSAVQAAGASLVDETIIFKKLEVVTGDFDCSPAPTPVIQRVLAPKLHTVGGELSSIESVNLETFSAPLLKIAGAVTLRNIPNLKKLELTTLTFVSDDFILDGTGEDELLYLPFLKSIGGDMTIQNNKELGLVYAPALEDIADDLIVQDNAHLKYISTHSLRRVGGKLVIQNNDDLRMLLEPSLQLADEVAVSGNKYLTVANFPSLKYVRKDVTIGNSPVVLPRAAGIASELPQPPSLPNPSLKYLNLPLLKRADDVTVDNNKELHSVRLPSLKTAESVHIRDNNNLKHVSIPVLPTVEENIEVTDQLDDMILLNMDSLKTVAGDLKLGTAVSGDKSFDKVAFLPSLKAVAGSGSGPAVSVADDILMIDPKLANKP